MKRTLSGGGARPLLPRDKHVVSPKGWGKVKPSSVAERAEMPSACFLRQPSSYPVCNKNTGNFECRGFLAAKRRAQLVATDSRSVRPEARAQARAVARRAVSQARSYGCEWAKRGQAQADLSFAR